MGELFGEKDYILDTEELRTWIRILEEPVHYGDTEREPSGCALREEPFGSEPRSLVIMPDELPEGHEVLSEDFAAPPPELPCGQQIGALIEGLKDMVNSFNANSESSRPGRAMHTVHHEGIPDRWEGLLTPDDASAYLRIPKTALHRECRKRAIAYESINGRGDRRFHKEDLDVYLERQRVAELGSTRTRKDTGKEGNKSKHPKGDEQKRRIKQDRNFTDLRKEIQKLWQ